MSLSLETRSCTLCGPSAPKRVKFGARFDEADLNRDIFSARRAPDRRHFQLVECERCGIIFSDPACDAARLGELYQRSAVTYETLEQQVYESYEPILDRALQRLGKRGVFLEIGGGAGFMLRYGTKRGFAQQVEVEPSEDAEQRFSPPGPSARFIRGMFSGGQLPEASTSLACFFQMLDHVPNPRAFLENVFRVLEPGGVAVCVTHNTRALSARLLGERSPIYDIEHTFLFAPDNLSELFQATGYGAVEAFPISNRYEARYWLDLAPLPRPVKRTLHASMSIGNWGGVRVPLKAGNFAVVAQRL
jgi:SAM-dependent methyltransferase